MVKTAAAPSRAALRPPGVGAIRDPGTRAYLRDSGDGPLRTGSVNLARSVAPDAITRSPAALTASTRYPVVRDAATAAPGYGPDTSQNASSRTSSDARYRYAIHERQRPYVPWRCRKRSGAAQRHTTAAASALATSCLQAVALQAPEALATLCRYCKRRGRVRPLA